MTYGHVNKYLMGKTPPATVHDKLEIVRITVNMQNYNDLLPLFDSFARCQVACTTVSAFRGTDNA
jgi:hypothetical protein